MSENGRKAADTVTDTSSDGGELPADCEMVNITITVPRFFRQGIPEYIHYSSFFRDKIVSEGLLEPEDCPPGVEPEDCVYISRHRSD